MDIMDVASTELSEEEIININKLSNAMNTDTIVGNQTYNMPVFRKQKQIFRDHEKIGRNQLCPCGSGKKYKHCCLKTGEYETTHSI